MSVIQYYCVLVSVIQLLMSVIQLLLVLMSVLCVGVSDSVTMCWCL